MTRWHEHVRDAIHFRGCEGIGRAIRCYGGLEWLHEELEVVSSRSEANIAEPRWIAQLNTIAPNGYNWDVGGVAPRHENVRDKIRATREAKPLEWRTAQNILLRKAHTKWLAASSVEERHKNACEAWRFIPSEERSAIAKKREAAKTPEQRLQQSQRIKASLAERLPEERSARARHAAMAQTSESRSTAALKHIAAMSIEQQDQYRCEMRERGTTGMMTTTPEWRRENARRASAVITPEQRKESARRKQLGWQRPPLSNVVRKGVKLHVRHGLHEEPKPLRSS